MVAPLSEMFSESGPRSRRFVILVPRMRKEGGLGRSLRGGARRLFCLSVTEQGRGTGTLGALLGGGDVLACGRGSCGFESLEGPWRRSLTMAGSAAFL